MLCQNCRNRDATVHLKRIIDGESMELHLCPDCASALGYSDIFSGFGPDAPAAFSALGGENGRARLGSRLLRCETCGFRLEDVGAASRPGCPACYRTFREKLLPYLRQLHGAAEYRGKKPARFGEENGHE